jgi:signal transduction histidine kinase
MDGSSAPYSPAAPGGHPHLIPVATATTGGILLLVAVIQAITVAQTGAPAVVVAFDFVFFGAPGATLVYTGFWMPRSDIGSEYYPRLVAWMLGGVAVMFGFVVLRDLHPAVSVDWATGTQAIALTIGSIGGLLIGIQETRATIRTTQLRERTEALTARERELERKNDRLEEFASVISHDLRNPLNVAQGHLELAREGIESEHLDTVADAHDRMGRLIDDLLTLARQGETISDTRAVDLADLGSACRQSLATTEATLSVTVDRAVAADRDRLRQLLENLLRNSVEHGGAGVTITIGELDGGDGFYVEDDGLGIPADARDQVFESGYTTSESGTGFGLRIVKQIAEAHGWDVRVTDGEDGGARFEFSGVEFVE